MAFADDAGQLTSDQRRHEIARLLAAGIIRLRKQRHLSEEPAKPLAKTSPDSTARRLEVSRETVLSVTNGLLDRES